MDPGHYGNDWSEGGPYGQGAVIQGSSERLEHGVGDIRDLYQFTAEEVDMLNTAVGCFVEKEQSFIRGADGNPERWEKLEAKLRRWTYGTVRS